MERPDSALAVLDTMDRTLLKNEHLRAHHALLHAMALDKNYIDVTDDSLSNVALKYYQNHGDKRNLVRSLYYKGLAYYYNEQYDKSISELSKAEPIAVVCDSLYLGFIQMLKANIYDLNYNDLDELECIKSALRIYAAINAVDYIDDNNKLLLDQKLHELNSTTFVSEENKIMIENFRKAISNDDNDLFFDTMEYFKVHNVDSLQNFNTNSYSK
jgi:tetratricopeptide (TPR) repeat protein